MNWLQSKILEYSKLLIDVINVISELDCLISLAVLAKELNFVKPSFIKEKYNLLFHFAKNQRLLDYMLPVEFTSRIFVDTFVPNDTLSDSKNGKVNIITGPNASGKSVYVKQVDGFAILGAIMKHWLVQEANCPHVFLNTHYYSVLKLVEKYKQLKTQKILANMVQSGVKVTEWMTLYKTIYHSIMIGNICKSLPQKLEIFRKVDFDESLEKSRFTVKFGVCEEIDNSKYFKHLKKRTYSGLPDLLTRVARNELDRLDQDIEECNVVYLPQLGYLLSIPITPTQKASGSYNIQGLDFMVNF
ncbi:MutS 5 [Nymphon striatum]|nr:MutS 5 [Nymphon striatum]KAG1692581.1 MutS 5 [Nymphon striatum]